jgi:hypothetical protein
LLAPILSMIAQMGHCRHCHHISTPPVLLTPPPQLPLQLVAVVAVVAGAWSSGGHTLCPSRSQQYLQMPTQLLLQPWTMLPPPCVHL